MSEENNEEKTPDESEEEQLGKSTVVETPDQDPRIQATGDSEDEGRSSSSDGEDTSSGSEG